MENSMQLSQKTKTRTMWLYDYMTKSTIWLGHFTPGYIPERNKNTNMHPGVHSAALFTITKIWKQPECLLTAEWIKTW